MLHPRPPKYVPSCLPSLADPLLKIWSFVQLFIHFHVSVILYALQFLYIVYTNKAYQLNNHIQNSHITTATATCQAYFTTACCIWLKKITFTPTYNKIFLKCWGVWNTQPAIKHIIQLQCNIECSCIAMIVWLTWTNAGRLALALWYPTAVPLAEVTRLTGQVIVPCNTSGHQHNWTW